MTSNFYSFNPLPEEEFEKGIRIKSLPIGNTTIRHMTFEPRSVVPEHTHPEEVVTLVLDGDIEMTVGTEIRRVGPGDLFVVSPNTVHSARIFDKPVIAVSWSNVP